MLKRLIVFALIVALLGCGSRHEVDPPRWVAERGDAQRLFVVGTVHVAPHRLRLPDDLTLALARCRTLVIEAAPPDQEMQTTLRTLTAASAANNLDIVGESLRDEFLRASNEIGLLPEQLRALKIWAATAAAGVAAIAAKGYFGDFGFDATLRRYAEQEGVQTIALETIAEQLSVLDQAPVVRQIEDLRELTRRMSSGEAGKRVAAMYGAWRVGDERAVLSAHRSSVADSSSSQAADAVLLGERNRRWAQRLATAELKSGCAVLAVGVLHLVGEDSLVEQLASKGFRITRVPRWEVRP